MKLKRVRDFPGMHHQYRFLTHLFYWVFFLHIALEEIWHGKLIPGYEVLTKYGFK